ncbi:MAG TPA: hypothetical protein VKB19_00185 [Pedobacter sp.]|nr:hypothetical protein [Pedobacter sp.]
MKKKIGNISIIAVVFTMAFAGVKVNQNRFGNQTTSINTLISLGTQSMAYCNAEKDANNAACSGAADYENSRCWLAHNTSDFNCVHS